MTGIFAGGLDSANKEMKRKVAACLTERMIRRRKQGDDSTICIAAPDDISYEAFPHEKTTWKDLVDHYPATISARMDRSLVNIHVLTKHPGDEVPKDEILQRITFSENGTAARFMIDQLAAAGYVTMVNHGGPILTVPGWNRVADLEHERGRKTARTAFIAASFDPAMKDATENGLMRGVRDAGYEPVVVDRREFTGKIDDYIIAEIRKCKFVVADFTGHRQSVYFEAGFAQGLELEVIWTCRKDEIEKAHFDTRQYNHIVWETPEELADKLSSRIRAVISSD